MYRARIVTPWTPANGGTNHPRLADEYDLAEWTDVTAQHSDQIPPAPNEYTIEACMTDAVFDAIDIDPTYEVLWSEEIEEVP